MKAIVLAAGEGSRLLPLTSDRPKHLLEVAGKSILQRLLDQLVADDRIDEILLVVHHHADLIVDFVTSTYQNGDITTIHQEKTNGTGDAVDVALQHTQVNDSFIVINGDVLFGEPIARFLDTKAKGVVVGARVDDPSAFGVLQHNEMRLTGIVEKPKNPPNDALINAGFYIFPPEAVDLFRDLSYSERGERELTDVIEQLVNMDLEIQLVPTDKEWFDVGKPWQLLNANEYFMDIEQPSYSVLGTVEPNVQMHGQVHVAATARIRSGVYIEGPVFIDEGADIGPNCYIRGKTYLGKHTRVGNACEIKNSIIYEDSHAAHLSYVGDSIIGRHSNLGAGTITANLRHDGNNVKMSVKGNRMDTGRRKLGAILGDYVKTGIGVDLLPGVKISSHTWLNAGEVVTRDK